MLSLHSRGQRSETLQSKQNPHHDLDLWVRNELLANSSTLMVGQHDSVHSASWLLLGVSSPAKQRQTSVLSSHATLLRSSRILSLRLSRQTSLMTSANFVIG